MKIQVKNLGALKQAEFSLGEFTIICGGNNTGKTYATYALFGFLDTWQRRLTIEINQQINEQIIDSLLNQGIVHIDTKPYFQQANKILQQACQNYTQQLPKVLSANPNHFKDSEFQIKLEGIEIPTAIAIERTIQTATAAELFSLAKTKNTTDLIVSLVNKEKIQIPIDMIKQVVSETICEIIFQPLFPNPFIASAERTGAAIFRKELNFARNRLLEEMSQTDKNINPIELLFKVYQDYAWPVKRNVDFTRQLETIAKKNSFLVKKYPAVLAEFADLIGGEYIVTRNDELYFKPKNKRMKLTMDESSSAVRSLLDIGFYLHHVAKPGDLLIIDEPELNLHPVNQRRIARLFARLVNLGIKIFITTHSDYIVKELNTLIMLNHEKPYLKKIAQQEGYLTEELLSADKIQVYIAQEALIKLPGKNKKSRYQTLTAAKIDPQLGIEAPSFDQTINEMNRIQEAIIWGDELEYKAERQRSFVGKID